MTIPNLDEAVKKALNDLTKEDIKGTVYSHEILWYGVDSVAHAYVMSRARDISEGKLSQEEFIAKYGLKFRYEVTDPNVRIMGKFGFLVPLEKIEADGIFIPKRPNGRVLCFCHDYLNRLIRWDPVNEKTDLIGEDYEAKELLKRAWEPDDLKNPELVERAVRFGKEMWEGCVKGFEKHKQEQPQNVTELAQKLIAYYSEILR